MYQKILLLFAYNFFKKYTNMADEVDDQVFLVLHNIKNIIINNQKIIYFYKFKFDDENHDDVETYSSDKKKHPFARESKYFFNLTLQDLSF